MHITKAKKDNARDLACLINMAGEGIPEYLWRQMIVGDESALDVGAMRAARDEGGFSYRNATLYVDNNTVMGMILAYQQEDPYEIGDLYEYPEIVRPLVALEAKVPGSWYIYAIATYQEFRGRGIASTNGAYGNRGVATGMPCIESDRCLGGYTGNKFVSGDWLCRHRLTASRPASARRSGRQAD